MKNMRYSDHDGLSTPDAAPEAATFAKRPNPVLKWIRTHCLERTLWRIPRTNKVLDLCCGYGFYFSINPHAAGIDNDPVSVGNLRAKGFDVQRGNVLAPLPYADGAFEHVIAHDVLEHFSFDDLNQLFDHVHRVLSSDGCFWVLVPNRRGYDYGVRIGVGHVLFVTAEEIQALIKGRFALEANYPEPLPRKLGRVFVHNKEVFKLRKL